MALHCHCRKVPFRPNYWQMGKVANPTETMCNTVPSPVPQHNQTATKSGWEKSRKKNSLIVMPSFSNHVLPSISGRMSDRHCAGKREGATALQSPHSPCNLTRPVSNP